MKKKRDRVQNNEQFFFLSFPSYMYFHSVGFIFVLLVILGSLFLNDRLFFALLLRRFDGEAMDVQCVSFFPLLQWSETMCLWSCLSLESITFWSVCIHNIGCCCCCYAFFFLTSGFLNWLNYQIVLHLIIFPYILHALHSCINGMSVQR